MIALRGKNAIAIRFYVMDMALSSLKSPPSPNVLMIPTVNQSESYGRFVLCCVVYVHALGNVECEYSSWTFFPLLSG